MSEKKTNKLAATFKSQDTEEWLDIHFTRPLGLLWANFFNLFGLFGNVFDFGVFGKFVFGDKPDRKQYRIAIESFFAARDRLFVFVHPPDRNSAYPVFALDFHYRMA